MLEEAEVPLVLVAAVEVVGGRVYHYSGDGTGGVEQNENKEEDGTLVEMTRVALWKLSPWSKAFDGTLARAAIWNRIP